MWYKNGVTFGSKQEIRQDNKESSLPCFLSDSMIQDMGYQLVVDVKPTYNEATEYVVEGDVVLVAGVPTKQYAVSAKSAADITAYQANATNQLKEHFKNMYLTHVNAKLKALDYDSLATVKLWEGDPTFGAEATRILNWYKAIIAMNYALITNVSTGAAPIPTDVEYQAMLEGIVF